MQSDLTKDFFTLFGFPVSYNIDVEQLTERYRNLQRQVHPDNFAIATEQEKRLAMQLTTRMNEGYNILKDQLERGRYLLELKGIVTNEETDTAMPAEFLMEQMELREQLDVARQDSDPLGRLEAMNNHLDQLWAARVQRLSECFQKDSEKNRLEARNLVREMQFLQKLSQEIADLEAGLV